MKKIVMYCDGSCLGNPGPGGYAAVLAYTDPQTEKTHEREVVGGAPHTTNNRMELLAAIDGLKALKTPCAVDVYTDSNYVVKGMKEWVAGWQKNGWRNAKNKPVENSDLWKQLVTVAATHHVAWHWVKGHAGHAGNERVDELARQEAVKQQAKPAVTTVSDTTLVDQNG